VERKYDAGVAVGPALIGWFRGNARVLPWRGAERDSYHVLVSELMLQQTQVDRVVPRFEAFIRRFPSLQALAAASEEAVLESWSGLGYYSRARRLHALARRVVDDGGALPQSPDELERLPGIGPYTAAAVASLAFRQPAPVVDGNVRRVAARVLELDGDVRRAGATRTISAWVLGLMGECAHPGEVNEALMELGATVCLPRDPRCGSCPVQSACGAFRSGRQLEVPLTRAVRAAEHVRWVAACCVRGDGRWLLQRVTTGPILRGLWLPPIDEIGDGDDAVSRARRMVPVQVDEPPVELRSVRHAITHRRIEVVPVLWSVSTAPAPSDERRWSDPSAPGIATSSLLDKLVDAALRQKVS
jgi:A/G-specific adenine glycosylase